MISIIIPCYNQAQYLKEAIDSALNQTYKNVEIVVVNDGSTDNTDEVIEPYLQNQKIIYKKQSNKGLPGARNFGIQFCSGDFILPLDADDVMLPEWLEECLKFNPNDKTLISTPYEFYNKDLSEKLNHISPSWHPVNEAEIFYGMTTHASVLYTKKLWQDIGGYDEFFVHYEDWEFTIRALDYGCQIYTIDRPMIKYRRHGVTLTDSIINNNDKRLFYFSHLLKKHEKLIEQKSKKLYNIIQLYKNILSRYPDQQGLNHYYNHNTVEEIKDILLNSEEYRNK